jgi:hypothetical protein
MNWIKALLALSLAFILVAANPMRASEKFVVIVNKENNQVVELALVSRIYMGTSRSWPDGTGAIAYDLPEEDDVRIAFSRDFLNRTVANMRIVWSQNIFSGRAIPPKKLNSDLEVKNSVVAHKNAVGYIRASQVDDSVRVIER